jgi:hypothetical protein
MERSVGMGCLPRAWDEGGGTVAMPRDQCHCDESYTLICCVGPWWLARHQERKAFESEKRRKGGEIITTFIVWPGSHQ